MRTSVCQETAAAVGTHQSPSDSPSLKMMYVEESLGSLDVSKLVNVPRWTHPFKVETTQVGLPSSELRSAVLERIKAKHKEDLEQLQAERQQQAQAELDEMAMQMAGADFGARPGAGVIAKTAKPLAKSDAALAEEKRKAEQQKRVVEEQELAAKKARLEEIDISLREVESKLETLNSEKHDLFVQFRQVMQLEEYARMEAQRKEEERRRAAEEMQRRLLSPSPTGGPLTPLSPSPVGFGPSFPNTTSSQTPNQAFQTPAETPSPLYHSAPSSMAAPPHSSGSYQSENRYGPYSDQRRRTDSQSQTHQPNRNSSGWSTYERTSPGNSNDSRKRTYSQFNEYDKNSSSSSSTRGGYTSNRPPFRSPGGSGSMDSRPSNDIRDSRDSRDSRGGSMSSGSSMDQRGGSMQRPRLSGSYSSSSSSGSSYNNQRY